MEKIIQEILQNELSEELHSIKEIDGLGSVNKVFDIKGIYGQFRLIIMNETKFLPPWVAVDSKGSFEDELTKEVSNEHLLFGKNATAIAKREDKDDVLFELNGNRYAIVHLTWKGAKEHSPEYPRTQLFDNWAAIEERIIRDNEAYNS